MLLDLQIKNSSVLQVLFLVTNENIVQPIVGYIVIAAVMNQENQAVDFTLPSETFPDLKQTQLDALSSYILTKEEDPPISTV